MTFGEKIRELRQNKNLSQTELAAALGVSLRTIRGWEIEGRYPKQHDLYQRLAVLFECPVSYLMTEEEAFITEASETYGARGASQARAILDQTAALFAGGDLSEEDQIAFLNDIQTLYLDSKKRARKFTPDAHRDPKH